MAFKNMQELEQGIAASGQTWSDADKALAQKDINYGNSIYTLKNEWINATKKGDTSAAQEIHDRTEEFRKQYGGYYGGADGSGYVKDNTYLTHEDPYKGTLDSLADSLLGYEKFENPYQNGLLESAEEMKKFGSFVNPYQDRLDDLAEQLGDYEKFKNPYQDKIENAANQLANYGAFENPYQQQSDDLLSEYLGREPFSYDLENDPIWQQYRKTYLREGQRTREDTLGNYTAATGGQSSTAAVYAASQAQDYYAAQMGDKIPELYQQAYDRWLEEGDQYAKQLSTLRGLGSDALSAWNANRGLLTDQLAAWRSLGKDALSEWDANLGLLTDQLAAYRGLGSDALSEWSANLDYLKEQNAAYQGLSDSALKAWSANLGLLDSQIATMRELSGDAFDRSQQKWAADYKVNRDRVNDARYADETSYDRAQDAVQTQRQEQQDAYKKALEWMQMGLLPEEALASAAGLTKQEVQGYVNAVKAQQAAKSSGGRSGSTKSAAKDAEEAGVNIYRKLMEGGAKDYGMAYYTLRSEGYNTTDANRYAKYFAESYYPGQKSKEKVSILVNNVGSKLSDIFNREGSTKSKP